MSRRRRDPQPTVQVYGDPVPLPSPWEARTAGSLEDVQRVNAAEHALGCHGNNCDGRCAERSYARFSAIHPGGA